MDWKKLNEIKAKLLCYGIRDNINSTMAFCEQNPAQIRKVGSAGLYVLLDGKMKANVSLGYKYTERSMLELKKENGSWAIFEYGSKLCDVKVIPQPEWFGKKTSSGRHMYEVILEEGSNVLHSPGYIGCGYKAKDEGCKFCSLSRTIDCSSRDVAETISCAFKENSKYTMHLTQGTPLTEDKGALNYEATVREVRKEVPDIRVCIEMTPPEKLSYVKKLIDVGVTDFFFNLEIWNEKIRKLFCPGKARTARNTYFKCAEYALSQLGKNSVASVLIAGLEPKESTLEGAEELCSKGIIPAILPFHPFDGSELASLKPPSHSYMLEINEEVVKMMRRYDLDPKGRAGCNGCSACTLERCEYS